MDQRIHGIPVVARIAQCIKFASPVKTFLESFQMQERLLIILKMEYTLPEESEWSIISKNWDKIYVGDTKISLCVTLSKNGGETKTVYEELALAFRPWCLLEV